MAVRAGRTLDGRFGGYRCEWAFGDVGQSARIRKELMATLAPRLSVRDRIGITDKTILTQL